MKLQSINRDKDKEEYIVARVSGVDLPANKRLIIALTYIFGIGPKRSSEIIAVTKIDGSYLK